MKIPQVSNLSIHQVAESAQNQKSSSSAVKQVGQTFGELLDSLTESQQKSDNMMTRLAAGEDVDIHEVVMAAEETDINFRIAIAIRDKLVDAYREISRMSI
jgi:flagellar hook-basal body complex protein FliE